MAQIGGFRTENFKNLGSTNLLKLQNACCFDRSMIMEQPFQNYGLKVKHINLSDASKFSGIFKSLNKRI